MFAMLNHNAVRCRRFYTAFFVPVFIKKIITVEVWASGNAPNALHYERSNT